MNENVIVQRVPSLQRSITPNDVPESLWYGFVLVEHYIMNNRDLILVQPAITWYLN